MGHPFADRMRDALESWMNDPDQGHRALEGLLADDVVWHMADPQQEPLRGRDAVLEALGGDMAGVEVSGDLHDVLANDDHAVALVRVDITRGDDHISYAATEIVHHRDGKVTERWTMVDDLAAVGAFWSD